MSLRRGASLAADSDMPCDVFRTGAAGVKCGTPLPAVPPDAFELFQRDSEMGEELICSSSVKRGAKRTPPLPVSDAEPGKNVN